jgi:hypothetical protein
MRWQLAQTTSNFAASAGMYSTLARPTIRVMLCAFVARPVDARAVYSD